MKKKLSLSVFLNLACLLLYLVGCGLNPKEEGFATPVSPLVAEKQSPLLTPTPLDLITLEPYTIYEGWDKETQEHLLLTPTVTLSPTETPFTEGFLNPEEGVYIFVSPNPNSNSLT